MATTKTGKVILTGVKPLLFDRYMGSNDAKPEPIEKVYWTQDGEACLPTLNLYSSLTAENTKSVAKMFYGRNAKKVGMAVNSFLYIPETELTLKREGKPFHIDNFDKQFEVVEHVARLDKGIPNPKVRPMLRAPWTTEFSFEFTSSPDCSWEVMVKMFQQAGIIGLGTYRPIFGTYRVQVVES